ncbi:GH92 family glycosyl hydrolase [Chitinophaga sancti]|uniref:Alpha-1,2-mannosidase, putative n=1 Tax=Chitinophaga sancti TaxID=1004 RepID=A0A1K1Q5G7_9BACT|nr:GH92 family glycosyl hydrolase [Chitinophaga sancti]WQD61145.1 GH92 family glycosyl hydrolase [Chitinophaga sancti]WQG86728.1 GH92 family glycosyl hydrolase [Chitinophaga sancti]SFW55160.1 alpha-1,2-mannosidase, putative [Chitinophaga sancti]
MKKLIIPALLLASCFAKAQTVNSVSDPVEWVNPLMGTDSKGSLSTGNTYPAIACPWGMNFWMPQTGKMGDGWAYTYHSDKLRGFKQTHQPSPWINDYGQFAIMPVTKSVKFKEDDRASWFSHKAEVAKPYYYSVYLADHNVTTEITPTERAAAIRFTYGKEDSAFVVIDALDKGSYIKVLPAEHKIVGYTTKNSGGVPANFKNYFVLTFDKPFTYVATFKNGNLTKGVEEAKDNHVGAVIGFATVKGEQVNVKVASSFISPEQAQLNLNQEIGSSTFEAIRDKAKAAWNTEMSRIKVEGGTSDQTRTFYSCLYRSMLFPRKFYEYDAKGAVVHYSPYNGQVLPGYMFTDNGFWDTFRAQFPFFNMMYPSMNAHIMEGMVNAYKESGWLPEWASPGHRGCMIGSNSASLIADAYLKGVRGFDINTAYEAIIKNSNNEGPLESVGRRGVKYYNKLGYVPYDVKINENTARTLEYCYDDWTIWKLAVALNRPKAEIERFAKQARNYRNVFDAESKLMRGKNENGKFQTPFNPTKWGDAFTEGNSWHYSWSVFHDVQGLINLMGGKETFVKMLDSVFSMPPVFDDSYYGSTIHEIREMQIMNFGQYAHGNQPIQHMIYLYNYAGTPWKSQYWLREVMNRLYSATPDGYCGDEDNGQTSAWYVFSALGFYPVTPGAPQYVVGAPLFKKATVKLENGKEIVINAPRNSDENRYIRSATFNGENLTNNWLDYNALMKGATIDFDMDATPNKSRGISDKDVPYSMTQEVK